MKTVLEVIQATIPFFKKSGVESARLNIEHLLAHALGKKRMDLYLEFDRPLGDRELEPVRELVRRRATGEPLQHLLGTAEFMGRIFRCDKRALIPRQETEQLCEIVMAQGKAGRVVDVGTGSGIIALTLAAEWPDAEVRAVDVSADALALARENAEMLGLAGRVTFAESDLLAGIEGECDLLVANLPYIADGEAAGLAREVLRDPHGALFGGAVGTELIERLIAEAPRILRGRIALEIGFDQGPQLSEALARQNFRDIQVRADYQGRTRFLTANHG
jgi:release factor glutamine methyltransferase